MVVVSSKRTDNQMQDPQGGEFRMTGRAEQLSSMAIGATFNIKFDFNGAEIWPVNAGECFYTEVILIGVTNDQSPSDGDMELWKGGAFFSRTAADHLYTVQPTGDTITRITHSGSDLAEPSVTDDGSGNMQITMEVIATANANWVAIFKGLYATGDTIDS